MKHPSYETRDLTVGYDHTPLIRDICLSLERGEILALIGPNGAGKTTILKSITRQLAPLGGSVWLDGKDLSAVSGGALAKTMAVVLTERVRGELMTCEDVVATGRYPYTGRFGLLSEADRRKVREAMELVHIDALADRDFAQISDGQRQRVLLARALAQEPELLVLDEPTSYLDVRYKMEFLSVVQRLARERGLSVVMSLHEVELAQRIADRVACVKGERLERFGTPEEIFVPGYLASLYDLTEGSFDPCTGTLELEAPPGEPRVFVLCGAGTGAQLLRRLQRRGVPFAAGILWENDLDYPVARALGAEVVSVKPFTAIETTDLQRAKALIDRCDRFVSTLPEGEMTGWAAPLRELVRFAGEAGKNSDGL